MKTLKNISEDWEKALLIMSVILTFSALIYFIIKVFLAENEILPTSPSIPTQHSYLGKNAAAFTDDKQRKESSADPFKYSKLLAKTPHKEQPKTGDNQKPQQPPPKPKIFKTVYFSGILDSSSGEKIAFVSVTDEQNKKKSNFNLKTGENFDSFRLQNIENNQIVFTDNQGNKHSLNIHSSIKIELR